MRIVSDIERRLLVNFRATPEVVAPLLPTGMQPLLVNGFAVVGICLIRLGHVRPSGLAAGVGITSENAAHRIAVEWETLQGKQSGVFIPRRDSASRLTVLAGGRVFPGAHHHARFDVAETDNRVRVAYASVDGSVSVDAEVTAAENLDDSRLFADLEAASAFFRGSPVGLSPGRRGRLEGVALATDAWAIEPARPVRVRSSWFDGFPAGSVTLDSALLMRNVPVQWSPARR